MTPRSWQLSTASLVLALGLGCKASKKEEPTHAGTPPENVAAAGATPAPRAPAIVESDVLDLLGSWVAAQNAGQFDDYEKLYAARFTGTKRVGTREKKFDRAGWIADRKALFQKPFAVSAESPRISLAGSSAVVEFTQKWANASYRDSGQKQLVLLKDQELRIASEEMKTSELQDAAPAAAVPSFEEFAWVRERPGHKTVLLLPGPVDLNAVTGRTEYVNDHEAERPVVAKALAPSLAALSGQRFALYGEGGKLCEATAGEFVVLVDATPHFGIVQQWNGQDGAQLASRATRAEELWSLSQAGGRMLGLTLDTNACQGTPRFARSAQKSVARVWRSEGVAPTELGSALEFARKTKPHQELQRAYDQLKLGKGPWDAQEAPRAQAFSDGQGQTFVSLLLSGSDGGGCAAEFDATLWLLLEKSGPTWVVQSADEGVQAHSTFPRYLEPLFADFAFDLDGDGRAELLGGDDFFVDLPGGYRSIQNVSGAYFDCPC